MPWACLKTVHWRSYRPGAGLPTKTFQLECMTYYNTLFCPQSILILPITQCFHSIHRSVILNLFLLQFPLDICCDTCKDKSAFHITAGSWFRAPERAVQVCVPSLESSIFKFTCAIKVRLLIFFFCYWLCHPKICFYGVVIILGWLILHSRPGWSLKTK